MKINLSGECSSYSGNVFGMSPSQVNYCVRRSRNPQAMHDYLMGNWFTSGLKAVGNVVKSVTSPITSVVKKVLPGPAGTIASAALIPAATFAPAILPLTAAKLAVSAVQKAEQSSQAAAARKAEIARLESERIALLKKQQEETQKQQQQAAAATQQLQQAAAAASAATAQPAEQGFDFKKVLPFAGLALIPLLLSGER